MAEARTCPGAPTLLAYAEGRLDDAAREEAELHFDACADCLAAVAELGRWGGTQSEGAQPDGADRYEIGAQIARGGMGRILRAWDRKLGRSVALKTVADDRSATLMQRLRREMALTARLQHPSIVPIYDAGRLDGGEPYYAMRWIDGRTLRELIDECDGPEERLALLPIVLSLAEAIAYAHDQMILHRDLKPSNVVVGTFGETVVLDWGLAKDLRESGEVDLVSEGSEPDGGDAMTADGQVMGTPGYIAPEQTRGEVVDARADVYAVGIILLELATGKVARAGDLAPLYQTADQNVPPDLLTIIRRATHPELDGRYADGSELVGDLRRYAQGRLVLAHEYTVPQRIRRFVARHRLPVGLAAAFIAALAIGGTWAVARIVAERDAANDAKQVAQQQRERAEQRRDAAQHLVQFIVSDLQLSLDGIGRSDLLAKVAASVLEYFEGAPVEEGAAGATDLIQQSRTLHGLGAALVASSDIVGARRAYEASLARALAAGEQGEADADWWACSARERLAYVTTVEGDKSAARELLERVVADANAELQHAESPAKWAELIAPALISLYTLEDGGPARSLERLDDAERFATTPVGDPAQWALINADLRLAVSQYRSRLARDAGDLAGYRTTTIAMVDAARGAYEAELDNAGRQGNYVAALMEDASAAELQGDPGAAHQNLKVALEIAMAAADRDATNTLARATLGTTLQFLAKNARERDALEEAADYFARAESVATEIRQLAPRDVNLLRTQSASAAKYLCLVQNERGSFDVALAACSRSLEALEHAYTIEPEHPHRYRDIVSVSTLATLAALGAGRLQDSMGYAEQATSLARQLAEQSGSPRDQFALAEALVARTALAHRKGEAATLRSSGAEARRLLDALNPPPDPIKAAALQQELDRILLR